jgi:hypothetical protein
VNSVLCSDQCSDRHTFEGDCILRRPEGAVDVPAHAVAVITPQTGPVCVCGDQYNMADDQCMSQVAVSAPITARDLILLNVPSDAYYDRDISGESWEWTSPRGIYRLMMAYVPEEMVVFEFKQRKARQDRVQTLVSLKKYSVSDIHDFIIPLINTLS